MDENIKRIDEKITAAKEAAENGGAETSAESGTSKALATGNYYADNKTSFVSISKTECNFFMVNTDDYNNVCGYTSVFSVGAVGVSFEATFSKGNWYCNNNGVITKPQIDLPVYGTYSKDKITINGTDYKK